MAVPAVTPGPGLADEVVTANNPVIAAGPNPNGGFITNPISAPASLLIDPVGSAAVTAGGTTFSLPPGDTWNLIPGQITETSVNSPANNHIFSIVVW